MKAIGFYAHYPIDNEQSLLDLDVPTPNPTGRDLLVRVRAVSVNPVDSKVRFSRGNEGKPAGDPSPRILGFDAAGTVEAVGSDCSLFRPGDEVYYAGSIVRPGSNSELHLVDERIAGRKPANLSFGEAAALPLTTITAWEALFDRMHAPMGRVPTADGGSDQVDRAKTVLIVGGAGGVGSIATQIAREVAGLRVVATASREQSRRWCLEHGADVVINHHDDFRKQLSDVGIKAVEYAFCCSDTATYFDSLAEVIAPQGTICSIVGTDKPIDVSKLNGKSAGFVWELMFTRSRFQTEDMIEQHRLLNFAADLVEAGRLRSTVTDRLHPINAANLREAHRRIEAGHTVGKIVIEDFA